ncbi:MAG: cobalamin-binding protein [Nitrososphaerales archaeon]
MRICSFLPGATEILYELGLGDSVVGVTHACDFPPEASSKNIVVRSVFDSTRLNSEEIDRMIAHLVRQGRDVYTIDENTLKQLDPDLIVAQGLCEVCSPHVKELKRAMNLLNNKPEVIVLDPHDLDDILESIVVIARKVGRKQKGDEIVKALKERIDHVRSIASNALNRPKVLCIEWLDPLFSAGHWIPQMVELAGGINGISKRAQSSRRMEWREVEEFDPDIIVLMPCGFGIGRTMSELWRIEKVEKWKELKAVKNKEVYATDASPYFSRPGPRTVTGLEILAKVIHPELFDVFQVPADSYRKIY